MSEDEDEVGNTSEATERDEEAASVKPDHAEGAEPLQAPTWCRHGGKVQTINEVRGNHRTGVISADPTTANAVTVKWSDGKTETAAIDSIQPRLPEPGSLK